MYFRANPGESQLETVQVDLPTGAKHHPQLIALAEKFIGFVPFRQVAQRITPNEINQYRTGELIVQDFRLEELRHLADSHDDMIRAKGRRGLDVLNRMQKSTAINIEIVEQDFLATLSDLETHAPSEIISVVK
mgnify:CR=1 FL=1